LDFENWWVLTFGGALLLVVEYVLGYHILDDVRVVEISGAGLAAALRVMYRFGARRLRTFILDAPALYPGHDSSLLL
jgi:hypothetical protein